MFGKVKAYKKILCHVFGPPRMSISQRFRSPPDVPDRQTDPDGRTIGGTTH